LWLCEIPDRGGALHLLCIVRGSDCCMRLTGVLREFSPGGVCSWQLSRACHNAGGAVGTETAKPSLELP
jgi:hypothetical protein